MTISLSPFSRLGLTDSIRPQNHLLQKESLPHRAQQQAQTAHKDVLLSSLNRTEDLLTLVQDELDVPSTADDATTEHLGIEMNPTPSKSVLSSSETIYGQSLLSDLCNKLVNLRGDVAPINGIIVRVDSAALVRCSQLAAQSGQSLRQDLEQLRLQLGIQVPAVIALDNLHQLEGFQHLIKRLGPNKATGISIGELYGITRSISTT